MVLATVALVAATVASGLNAGFFFAFANDVMPALRRVDDEQFVRTFRALDRQVDNPVFLAVFLAAPMLAAASVALVAATAATAGLVWSIGGLLGALGTVAITGTVHVPMNGRLQQLGPVEEVTGLYLVRNEFATRWMRWNLVRTGTALVAFGGLVGALVAR